MLHFFAIISFSLVQSSCYKFYVNFRNFCYTTTTQNSSRWRREKLTCEKCETQTSRSIFWQPTRRCSTGTVQFTQCPNFSTTSQACLFFTSLVFSIDRWNLTAPSLDNIQVVLNNWSLLKTGTYSLASNKLQSILHAVFIRFICTLNFVASFECPDSTTLTGKNTSYTTFYLCSSSQSSYYLWMEAASWHSLSSIYLYII